MLMLANINLMEEGGLVELDALIRAGKDQISLIKEIRDEIRHAELLGLVRNKIILQTVLSHVRDIALSGRL